MLDALLILFGLFALVKGEFQLTHDRKVRGDVSRKLGAFMLSSAGLSFIVAFYIPGLSTWILLAALVITIVIGLSTTQKKVHKEKTQ